MTETSNGQISPQSQPTPTHEAAAYFRALLRDIGTMLAFARDRGLEIDEALREDITRLFESDLPNSKNSE